MAIDITESDDLAEAARELGGIVNPADVAAEAAAKRAGRHRKADPEPDLDALADELANY